MKKVLLVLAGWVHPPYRGRVWLKETLGALGGFSFDEASSLPEAVTRGLSGYDALVLYYHYPKVALADAELDAFGSFVRDGGGVLAVHSATASYKPTLGYFGILGGRFIGHGPVQPIDVRPARVDDSIFAGIPSFTVHDELYLHALEPDIEVHFEADHEGKAVPVVWTRNAGKGRICYLCPGHRAESIKNGSVQEILRRGMVWVSNL